MIRGERTIVSLQCLCVTAFIGFTTVARAERTLVDIVVAQNVKSELQPGLDRLATDLRNDGYTARITAWPAGKSPVEVWNHLKNGYDNDNLQGALLVGHIPVPQGEEKHDTDIPYWSMSSFSAMSPKHIWIGRFYAPPASDYGDEAELIANALDANHDYRTGASRCSDKAWTHSCDDRSPCKGHAQGVTWANTIRDTWPVTEAVKSSGLSYVLFAEGGDFLFETSHGTKLNYAGIGIKAMAGNGCRIRTAICNSCGAGALGGIVNFQNIGNNTLNVISIGSTYSVGWAYEEIAEYTGRHTRERVKRGDSWGMALLHDFPFKYQQQTAIYGDLSLPAMVNAIDARLPLYTITIVDRPGGTLTPSDSILVRKGGNVAFTITPVELFSIKDVRINGKSVGAVSSYTIANIQGNTVIEALFGTTSATVVSDDFESVHSNGGAGAWNGPWYGYTVSDQSPHGGDAALQFDGTRNYSRRDFSAVGNHETPIRMELWYRCTGEDSLRVGFHGDGNMFKGVTSTGGTYRRAEYDVTPFWEGESSHYRLSFYLPKNTSTIVYIDDIRIYGTGGHGDRAPGRPTNPAPMHSAVDVAAAATLSWTPGFGATSHTVYFGTDATPDADEERGTQSATVFDPGPLEAGATYYWRIDETNGHGTTTGDVWSFTTKDDAVGGGTIWKASTAAPRICCERGKILVYAGSWTGQPVSVTVVDMSGRIILDLSVKELSGFDIIALPARAHGTYYVTVSNAESRLSSIITSIANSR